MWILLWLWLWSCWMVYYISYKEYIFIYDLINNWDIWYVFLLIKRQIWQWSVGRFTHSLIIPVLLWYFVLNSSIHFLYYTTSGLKIYRLSVVINHQCDIAYIPFRSEIYEAHPSDATRSRQQDLIREYAR